MQKSKLCSIRAKGETISLHQYPAYKPSGLNWLGDVPSHWVARRIKTLFRELDERSGDGSGELLSLTRAHGLIPQAEASNRIASVSDLSNYKVCRPNSLVMNRMQAWSGMFAVPTSTGLISPDYCVFQSVDKCDIKYFEHLFKTPLLVSQFAQRSKGIGSGFNRLYTPDFGNVSVPCPPLDEQIAIVRYLDQSEERIRRAISAKERLIVLLIEQRQAVIHRAVTHGLDSDVPLKDSGVEWLGDVPAHWAVRRIKSLSVVKRGASPRPIDDPRYFNDNGEYAWVRISDVTASNRYLQKTTQRLSEIGQALSVRIEPGNMFLSIAGSVGKPIITKIKCCIHDGFVYFPQFKGEVEFLYRVLSIEGPFAKLGKLGTQLNLNTETVGNIYLGWPPLDEQTAIVRYLDKATADIDTAIDKAQRQIDLLREYRICLIADVVMGKVDVRRHLGT